MQQIYDENHTNSPNISSKRASPERVRSERGGLTLLSFIGFVAAPGDGAVLRFFRASRRRGRMSRVRADGGDGAVTAGQGTQHAARQVTRAELRCWL